MQEEEKKIGNSIFYFEQQAGIDSPFGNWTKKREPKETKKTEDAKNSVETPKEVISVQWVDSVKNIQVCDTVTCEDTCEDEITEVYVGDTITCEVLQDETNTTDTQTKPAEKNDEESKSNIEWAFTESKKQKGTGTKLLSSDGEHLKGEKVSILIPNSWADQIINIIPYFPFPGMPEFKTIVTKIKVLLRPKELTTPWMDVANKELKRGVVEIPGPEHNPRILEYHATTNPAPTTDDNDGPWCSSFVNWCFTQVGIKGTNSAWAPFWIEKWKKGKTLEKPAYGAVGLVKIWKDKEKTSYTRHVGFIYGMTTDEKIAILGGNQGKKPNSVTISYYSLADFIGFTYPAEYIPNYNLPIIKK